MTGRYTIRLGTQSSVIYWDNPWGVPINETFLAQNLKAAGYHTALFGKWHLGSFKEEYTPMGRGFDEHVGYYQGCGSAYTHIAACCTAGSDTHDQDFVCEPGGWTNNTHSAKKDFRGYDWFASGPSPNDGVSVPDFSKNHSNSATLIKEAALDFLGRNAKLPGTPFFLYLPFQNVHSPYTCDQEWYDKYAAINASGKHSFNAGEMTMFGYMTEMDAAVGEVMTAFHKSGKYENSFTIFSSDNGAPPAGSVGPDGDVDHIHTEGDGQYIRRNFPYRGWKTQIWDGGVRVAGFIHSPLLPAKVQGTVSHELYHITDWLPTIASLTGASTSRNFPMDGHNLWPSLSTGTATPRTEMLYNINPLCHAGQAGNPKAALRMGDYKVLTWCYEVAGIGGGNVTRPVHCTPDASRDAYGRPVSCDPEFQKGAVLFDLATDPRETQNIAATHPDVVEKMLARLKVLAEEMVEPQQWVAPFQGESYFCKDCPLHPGGTGVGHAWGPWIQ